MQLLYVCGVRLSIIDDISSKKNTTCHALRGSSCHVIQRCCSCCVCRPPTPAPTSTLQGVVVCVVSDNKLGCFLPLSDVWLAGWSHTPTAHWPCLSDASCARDQRKPCSRSRPSVGTHSNQMDQPTNLPCKDMGVFTPNSPKLTV